MRSDDKPSAITAEVQKSVLSHSVEATVQGTACVEKLDQCSCCCLHAQDKDKDWSKVFSRCPQNNTHNKDWSQGCPCLEQQKLSPLAVLTFYLLPHIKNYRKTVNLPTSSVQQTSTNGNYITPQQLATLLSWLLFKVHPKRSINPCCTSMRSHSQ